MLTFTKSCLYIYFFVYLKTLQQQSKLPALILCYKKHTRAYIKENTYYSYIRVAGICHI